MNEFSGNATKPTITGLRTGYLILKEKGRE